VANHHILEIPVFVGYTKWKPAVKIDPNHHQLSIPSRGENMDTNDMHSKEITNEKMVILS
jgi:hypothetical protein